MTNFATDANFSLEIIGSSSPQNDLACNAIELPVDGTVQEGFTNECARVNAGEEAIAPSATSCSTAWCAEELGGGNTIQVNNSVWFSFEAPESNAVEISTCGMASFDSQLALYEATNCGDFSTYTLIGANDDGPASCSTDFDSRMEAHGLNAGQNYYVMVDGYQGASGEFGISITEIMSTSTEAVVDQNNEIKLYPNPSNGQFMLEWNGEEIDDAQIAILSITGQMVHQQKANASGQQEIDLSGIAKGLYLVQIKTEERIVSKKLTIQ